MVNKEPDFEYFLVKNKEQKACVTDAIGKPKIFYRKHRQPSCMPGLAISTECNLTLYFLFFKGVYRRFFGQLCAA
jgi:hypothetical protein